MQLSFRMALMTLVLLVSPVFAFASQEPPATRPSIDPTWRTKAKERSQRSITLFVTQQLATAMFLASLAARGGSVQLRKWLDRRLTRRWARNGAFIASVLLMLAAVNLPFAAARFILSKLYGVATQSFPSWLADFAIATAVDVGLLVALGTAFYWLVDRKPRTWWRWASTAVLPIALVAVAAGPLYISIFNDFTPIANRALADGILDLAASEGIPAKDVYQIDLGRRTNAPNAFVSGVGPTAVVALGDNLLSEFTPEEILFVTAHEMAHYVGRHLWKGLVLGWLLAILTIWLVQGLARWALTHLHDKLQIDDISDVASFPLLLLISGLLMAAELPLVNAISRSFEVEADRYALERTIPQTVSYEAAESMFERLGMLSLTDPSPNPVIQIMLGTHPPIDDRIEMIRKHKAANP